MRNPSKTYYERYWSAAGFNPSGRTTPGLDALYRRVIPPEARCLDIGCGDGRSAGSWLIDTGHEYVGVDLAANALRRATTDGVRPVVLGEVTTLPFPDGSFDAAVCVEVLEHLIDPATVVEEARRVLVPGGLLMVTVPNTAFWCRRIDLALFGRWNPVGDLLSVEQPWRDPHVRFFTRAALRRLLISGGFHHVEVGGHDGAALAHVPVLRRWASSPSRLYRAAEARMPSLLGLRLYAIGTA